MLHFLMILLSLLTLTTLTSALEHERKILAGYPEYRRTHHHDHDSDDRLFEHHDHVMPPCDDCLDKAAVMKLTADLTEHYFQIMMDAPVGPETGWWGDVDWAKSFRAQMLTNRFRDSWMAVVALFEKADDDRRQKALRQFLIDNAPEPEPYVILFDPATGSEVTRSVTATQLATLAGLEPADVATFFAGLFPELATLTDYGLTTGDQTISCLITNPCQIVTRRRLEDGGESHRNLLQVVEGYGVGEKADPTLAPGETMAPVGTGTSAPVGTQTETEAPMEAVTPAPQG